MSLIRTILSIIGMIVVFSIVAEYLIMPIYTRQNQNRIMIDIKNKHLDDAINILKSEITYNKKMEKNNCQPN